jgi:nitrogen fixation NifU-like protein
MEGNQVRDVRFEGNGCAISMASASMMTDALKGKTSAEAEKIFQLFHQMITSDPGVPLSDVSEEELGKLAVFSGVCEYPARVKCAALSWHAVHNALKGEAKVASTEEGSEA